METSDLNITNRQLVAEIYEKYLPELKLYFAHYTHDMAEAEDMVQDLFIKILKIGTLCEKTARNLLFVTARHMIIDDARHKAYIRMENLHLQYRMELIDNSVYDRMERNSLLELERNRLQTMPQKRAAAYRLWRQEKTMKEIAQELNIAQRTAETHVYLAMCEMKKYLRAAM